MKIEIGEGQVRFLSMLYCFKDNKLIKIIHDPSDMYSINEASMNGFHSKSNLPLNFE